MLNIYITKDDINDNNVSYQSKNIDKITVIFLDWDDTLLPTDYLTSKPIKYNEVDDKESLELLIDAISKLFVLFDKHKIIIATNALYEWIFDSIRIYYPEHKNLFDSCQIISCREKYNKFNSCGVNWKYQCFKKILLELNKGINQIQMISIGDSENERCAILSLKKDYPNLLIKTIKLMSKPDILDCINQVNHLITNMTYILNDTKDMDVKLNIITGKLDNVKFPFQINLLTEITSDSMYDICNRKCCNMILTLKLPIQYIIYYIFQCKKR